MRHCLFNCNWGNFIFSFLYAFFFCHFSGWKWVGDQMSRWMICCCCLAKRFCRPHFQALNYRYWFYLSISSWSIIQLILFIVIANSKLSKSRCYCKKFSTINNYQGTASSNCNSCLKFTFQFISCINCIMN